MLDVLIAFICGLILGEIVTVAVLYFFYVTYE